MLFAAAAGIRKAQNARGLRRFGLASYNKFIRAPLLLFCPLKTAFTQ
jgi:hypothetical protein